MEIFLTHAHTDASNLRLRDCINKTDRLIDYCAELGLEGVTITDHEALSNHMKASSYVKKAQKDGKIPESFKVGFGNEIYLVDREFVQSQKEQNEKIQFFHFILIAKDQKGYHGLKKLSSLAWENSFFYRGMERTPTYKDDLEQIMEEYKGHIIASSACVGGEIPQLLIEYKRSKTQESKIKVHETLGLMKKMFGDDFYLELQPNNGQDQLDANEMLLKISKLYDIKCIVATDAHYLNRDQAVAHETYLTASQGDREIRNFYSTTYVMNKDEL